MWRVFGGIMLSRAYGPTVNPLIQFAGWLMIIILVLAYFGVGS